MGRQKEGGLQAPTRHAINWKAPEYFDEDALFSELERAFDICHGCRRCVSLCQSFPTLFDLVDASETFEVNGVAKQDYWQVVAQCYLCDLCYMTKCPYVPPHECNLDFPHLMLRAKAVNHQQHGASVRNKLLASTDALGKLASIPVVSQLVNAVNASSLGKMFLEKTLGVDNQAVLPTYHSKTARKTWGAHQSNVDSKSGERTTGKVAIFTTCYGNYNAPDLVGDLLAVFEHNKIAIQMVPKEQCCGMPKLELGDLPAVEQAKENNAPQLLALIADGWDIIAPVPSCVLMFKQELPLLFAEDNRLQTIKQHIFDPFEYLALRHQEGLLQTEFKNSLGTVSYHVACHQRVQNIGPKTLEILRMLPETTVTSIERCSGHDGTYGVKTEFHAHSRKIARPVVNKVKQVAPDYFGSDCPMAGNHIVHILADDASEKLTAQHPMALLRIGYGI